MSTRQLPAHPSLENLKKQAKTLLKQAGSGDTNALDRIGPYFGDPAAIGLQQAHLVIAREYGFSSWSRLKRHIESDAPQQPTSDQFANRFLYRACLIYDRVDKPGPDRFAEALELLEAHPDIRNESIYTAAAIGDAGMIDQWLDRDPGLIDRKGGYFHWAPLMYAAYARLPGTSTLQAGLRLLERGADPNAHYMWGGQYRFTALTGVFGQGEDGPANQPEHPDMVAFARALLQAGADPNDSQAAYNRLFEPDNTCLELLIEYGLKPQDRNNWFEVEGGSKLPSPNETMQYQLIQAIHRGNFERAKLLIDAGVSLDKPDNTYETVTKGRTPYEAAMLLGQRSIADYLLAAGATGSDLSDVDRLQAALMAGDAATAGSLLEADRALMQAIKPRRDEMLHDAAATGNHRALRAMVDLGFDIRMEGQRSPLHMAAFNGDTETVRLLIELGADPALRDPDHLSPAIGFALHAGRDDIVAFLETQNMDVFTAAARGLTDRLHEMIGEDPGCLERRFTAVRPPSSEVTDRDWLTPLAVAVSNGHIEAARFLLEQGADPAASDGKGLSLLGLAQDVGDPDIVRLINSAMRHD